MWNRCYVRLRKQVLRSHKAGFALAWCYFGCAGGKCDRDWVEQPNIRLHFSMFNSVQVGLCCLPRLTWLTGSAWATAIHSAAFYISPVAGLINQHIMYPLDTGDEVNCCVFVSGYVCVSFLFTYPCIHNHNPAFVPLRSFSMTIFLHISYPMEIFICIFPISLNRTLQSFTHGTTAPRQLCYCCMCKRL